MFVLHSGCIPGTVKCQAAHAILEGYYILDRMHIVDMYILDVHIGCTYWICKDNYILEGGSFQHGEKYKSGE